MAAPVEVHRQILGETRRPRLAEAAFAGVLVGGKADGVLDAEIHLLDEAKHAPHHLHRMKAGGIFQFTLDLSALGADVVLAVEVDPPAFCPEFLVPFPPLTVSIPESALRGRLQRRRIVLEGAGDDTVDVVLVEVDGGGL